MRTFQPASCSRPISRSHTAPSTSSSPSPRPVTRTAALRSRFASSRGRTWRWKHVESELHGWSAAPYDNKADVDASYCRLLDVALRAENAGALRVGVASHNLFHVAWALELAESRGVAEQLDVEMLEGMANPEARALVASGQPVLLYAPVTQRDDFASAVAYLVRRLDENTAPENYLRAAPSSPRTRPSSMNNKNDSSTPWTARHGVGTRRKRTDLATSTNDFVNEPDGDPTDATYAKDVTDALEEVRQRVDFVIDSLDHLSESQPKEFRDGRDPNDHGRVWYRYRAASLSEIDEALEFASAGFATWHRLTVAERQATLRRAADLMSERAREHDRGDGARRRQDRRRGRSRGQ